jgi:hypothetical protein
VRATCSGAHVTGAAVRSTPVIPRSPLSAQDAKGTPHAVDSATAVALRGGAWSLGRTTVSAHE